MRQIRQICFLQIQRGHEKSDFWGDFDGEDEWWSEKDQKKNEFNMMCDIWIISSVNLTM